jgi:hypothetical protein
MRDTQGESTVDLGFGGQPVIELVTGTEAAPL